MTSIHGMTSSASERTEAPKDANFLLLVGMEKEE
jgi:hypothetical protein